MGSEPKMRWIHAVPDIAGVEKDSLQATRQELRWPLSMREEPRDAMRHHGLLLHPACGEKLILQMNGDEAIAI
jgi:hypothetical protein